LAVVENSTTSFFIDDNDDNMSSVQSLSFSFSTYTVMPADVEFMTSQLHRSPHIAAMKAVPYIFFLIFLVFNHFAKIFIRAGCLGRKLGLGVDMC
jgi:hypothetical protein